MADQGQSGDLLWSSELRLELLGPVRLGSIAGDEFTPKARKTRALLAIVALAKGPVPRSRLIELLWGDRGEEQAKASLRQALYELRELASAGYLTTQRESVALGPKKLPTDLALVQRAIADGDAQALSEYVQGIECPLLATLDDVTPELDEWLRDERTRLTSGIVAGSCAVAEAALDKGEFALAGCIASELERLDPLDERAAQLGIRADLAGGDRAGASRRHARLKARLKEQLGVSPAPETDALLAAGRSRPRSAGAHEKPPSASLTRPTPRRGVISAAVALLLIAVAAGYFLLRSSPAPAEPTVAVLPFAAHGNGNEDYFASGVSDEILNLLARQKRLKVLGRISAEQLASPGSLERARQLGIGYLLDGSVRSGGDRVLVIARLTRVSDGAQVWSERYERRAGDIFAVQGEIAGAVATRLAQSFAGVRPQETRPEVYDRYLAARQLVRQRRDVTLREAERLLKEAIALDPNYAPALAELAQVMMLRTDHPTSYGPLPLGPARTEAGQYARRAVSLDPNLGEAYAALGFLSLNDERSEPYYRKAVELDPQRPEFHRWLGASLMKTNRIEEALAEFTRAVAIDPLWGLNYEHLCGTLRRLGRDAEAARYEQQFLRLSSDEGAKLQFRIFMADSRSEPAEELRYARQAFEMYPNERQSRVKLASTLALLGERREAAKLISNDPIAAPVLNGDWRAVGLAVRGMGPDYWDYGPGYWNLDSLLIASGQSRVIVDLYDKAKPLAERGLIDRHNFVGMTTALALLQNGRTAEAQAVWNRSLQLDSELPAVGKYKQERELGVAVARAFRGDTEPLIALLDRRSRERPFRLAQLPAMSLRYVPMFRPVAGDRRFQVIDERLRASLNAERVKAGLPPVSREAWISDPKVILTKN